jgi:cytochrome c peroxidase
VARGWDGRRHDGGTDGCSLRLRGRERQLHECTNAFTPSLRNVALTAPYMHDGSIATLEDVIDFYERGGIANPNLDPDIRPLRLSAEEVAFLRPVLCGVGRSPAISVTKSTTSSPSSGRCSDFQ